MVMNLYIKPDIDKKVDEDIKQGTDYEVQQKLSEESMYKALSRLVNKDSKPIKPFQFNSTKSAEMMNNRILMGSVYNGSKF